MAAQQESGRLASDALHDYTCSLCDTESLNNEASVYCSECADLMCVKCERFHAKLHSNHRVLDRENVNQWGEVKRRVSMVTCEEHPGELIRMLCRSHDKVCCTVCAFKYHRSCNDVDYIPDVAVTDRQTYVFEDLPKRAARITTKLRKTLEEKLENRESLKQSRREFIGTLDDMQREYDAKIEALKKATLEDMSKLSATLDETIQSEMDSISKLDEEIEYFMKLVNRETDGATSEPICFIGNMKCKEKLSEAEALLVKNKRYKYDVKFERDSSFLNSVASMASFGTFHVSTAVRPLNVLRSNKCNVRAASDKYTCEICGICQLPSAQVVVVDRQNQNVKLLSTQMMEIDVFTPPKFPQSVCPVGDNEVAVSVNKMNKRHEVHFLKVHGNKLVFNRMFSMNHDCFGIFHGQSMLYVTSLTALYTYTTTGRLVKKLYEDTSSEMTVGVVTVSDDGRRLYSRSFNARQVYTLDQEGSILSTFNDPFVRWPNCLALTDDGSLLVGCWGSKTIVQLDGEGKRKLATVATATDGVNVSYCMWFDRGSSRLLVGQKTADDVLVLQLG